MISQLNEPGPASTSRYLRLARGLAWMAAAPGAAWAATALWFVPPGAAIGFILFCGVLTWVIRHRRWTPIGLIAATAVIFAGWLLTPARNDRTWTPDTAQMASGEI